MAIIKFFMYKKKFHETLFQWFYKQKCCVADCGYVHLFCNYLSKNEAVKLSFTLFMFCYIYRILYKLYFSRCILSCVVSLEKLHHTFNQSDLTQTSLDLHGLTLWSLSLYNSLTPRIWLLISLLAAAHISL